MRMHDLLSMLSSYRYNLIEMITKESNVHTTTQHNTTGELMLVVLLCKVAS